MATRPATRPATRARRVRADDLLVRLGLAVSTREAQALILAGLVWSDEERVEKAGELFDGRSRMEIRKRREHVSRAGGKLAGALDAFAIAVQGRRCLDVGASTGGFTECLLSRGAAEVTALDVGRGQLDARLRSDRRVTVVEGRNARLLSPADFPHLFSLVTVDVSFISLSAILPVLPRLLDAAASPPADILLLVKPQFEAPREKVPRGGVVRDPEVARAAVDRITGVGRDLGLVVGGQVPSILKGARGNQEHFLWLRLQ